MGEGAHGRRIRNYFRADLCRLSLADLGQRSPGQSQDQSQKGERQMTMYIFGGYLAAGLFAYLLYALIKPEKF